MKLLSLLAALALGLGHAATADVTIGLNFCDNWAAPHVGDGMADGFAGWTDSRAEGDTTHAAVQTTPLALGTSGVLATWNASNSWSAGSETTNEQGLYRVYLDDGQTSTGVGVQVTISGLGGWLTRTGTIGYRLRCYSNNDSANTFQPISVRNGSSVTATVIQTIAPTARGNGDFPTSGSVSTGESRGYGDSAAALTADTITLTIPPRSGAVRGTLCAFKITASGVPAVPPVAITLAAAGVTDSNAMLNGTVNANSVSTAASFEYGLTTSYGNTLAAVPATVTGATAVAVSAALTGLTANTTYHYRVVATSTAGTTNGPDATFTTGEAVWLAGLSVNAGALTPVFAKRVTNYAVQVPFATTTLRVTPVAEAVDSTIEVQGVAVASGAASEPIPLAVGNTPLEVAVTAAGGTFATSYVVTVTRLPETYAFSSAATVPVTAAAFDGTGETAGFSLNFAPPTGTDLTVVKNTGLPFIKGAFGNLKQGQSVKLAYNGITYPFVADYYGGSGNDLVLRWAYTKVYGWGDNTYAAYGSSASSVPLAVGPAGAIAGKTVSSLAVGSGFTLALCTDGTLAATGWNDNGALGNGASAYQQLLPVAINANGVLPGKRVVAIAAGENHSLALCSDGTVAGWGQNLLGQVGDGGGTGGRSYPVAVSTTGVLAGRTVVAIAAGSNHNLALCADGFLATWGNNTTGELGNGSTTHSNVPVAVITTGALSGKTITAIAAGGSHCIVLCSDGNMVEWGSGNQVPVAVNRTGALVNKVVTAIATTYYVTLAICADGTVVAWGDNGMGGLGDGSYTARSGPVAVTATGVLSGKAPVIVAGSFPGLALCSDGTLAAWGDNQRAQFGDGTSTTKNVPTAASLATLGSGEKFTGLAIGASARHTMAIAAVPLSGNSKLSGLVLGGAVLNPGFEPLADSYIARVMHGATAITVTPTAADGMAKITINDSAVVSGVVSGALPATPGSTVKVNVTAESGSGTSYVLTVREDATLASLGLSQGSLLPVFSPFVRNYSTSVSAGTASLLVTPVTADPTAAVTVNGTPAPAGGVTVPLGYGANPVTVVVTALDGTVGTYQVIATRAASVNFTYTSATAVPLTVSAYEATGNTVNLALGFAPATNLTVVNNTGTDPITGRFANLAQGQPVKLIYNGASFHFVANYFGGDGNDLVLQWAATKLYGWGFNSSGQVGSGGTSRLNSPTAVSGALAGRAISAMAVGASHTLALCADGTLVAWGNNTAGQLGNGDTTNSSVPVAVAAAGVLVGKTVVAIAAGSSHSLALCADGTLAAWGDNRAGQLGNGLIYPSSVPVAVTTAGALTGKRVTAISAGSEHSLALCSDGTVVAWGGNGYGQLGNGANVASIVPVAVATAGALAGKIVTGVSAGRYHSLVRCSDGSLAAWGYNSNYQLADGTTTARSVPVAIARSGVLTDKTVVSIAAGGSHNLALCSDGAVIAWGSNDSSQLGNGAYSTVPVLVSTNGVLAGRTVTGIAASSSSSFAMCADGTLAFWGHDLTDLGGTPYHSTPVAVSTAALGAGEKVVMVARGALAGHAQFVTAVPLSTDSKLAVLAVSTAILNPVFAPGITEYTARVPHGTTAVTVTPTASEPHATVTVNGVPLASGVTSAEIPLSPGNMTLTVRATAQNGSAVTSYVITFKDDSTLSALALSAGTLIPGFAPTTTAYAAYVSPGTATLTLTPTAADASAAITVNGTVVASGNASTPVALNPGANTITVRGTALDGTVTTYALTVTRQVPVNYNFTSASGVAVTATSYTAAANTTNPTLGFAPPAGTNLMLVKNTGTAPLIGRFDNLVQGQLVYLTYNNLVYPFMANYYGGTGNDLVLQWASTRVAAWGYNYYGQLGNGGTVNSKTVGPVDATGVLAGKAVVAVAGGGSHSLALCADGALVAWGDNSAGQLGNGTTVSSAVPVLVNQTGVLAGMRVVAIAAGSAHNLVLCEDGTLAIWGNNSYGAYGTVPKLVDTTGVLAGRQVVAIAAGGTNNLVLCRDGMLAQWGGNSSTSTPVQVNQTGVLAGKTVTVIGAGSSHCLVACSDGTVAAWGANSGQLGDNTMDYSNDPVLTDRSGVLAGKIIASLGGGSMFSMSLATTGSLAGWGNSFSGQVGDGTTGSRFVPAAVTQTGVLAGKTVLTLACGSSHSLVVCADGSMAAWGENGYGQLGNNSNTDGTVPGLVSPTGLATGERFMLAGAGSNHSLAIVATPPPPLATTLVATNLLDAGATLNGTVHANGQSTSVAFEYGLTTAYGTTLTAAPATVTGTSLTPVNATLTGLVPGTTYHYRVVATSGTKLVRGADGSFTTSNSARLTGLTLAGAALMPTFAESVRSYAATVPNATTSIVVTPQPADAAATVKVNGVPVTPGAASAPVELAVGSNALVIVVTAAGSNTQTYSVTVHRLPETFAFDSAARVPVTATDFVATGEVTGFALNFAPAPGTNLTVVKNTGRNLIQGAFANLAQWQAVNLTFGGVTYRFAANYFGGTGNDLVLQWASTRMLAWGAGYGPVPVGLGNLLGGKSAFMISPGAAQNLILCTDGSVAVLNGSETTPTWVSGTGALVGKAVTSVAAGGTTHLALCSDGTVVSWSANGGVPAAVDQSGVLAGKTVIALAGGGAHSLALCSDGTLAAWGSNSNGQLGNGNTTNSTVPVLVVQTGVLAGKTVTAIGAGGAFSAALCADGSIATWGSGPTGQLGSGTPDPAQSVVPVLVSQAGVLSGKVVVAIAVGYRHTLALCQDGTVVAWGTSIYGELGDGSTSSRNVPGQITQTGVLAGKSVIGLAAGGPSSSPSYGQYNFALCADGTLAAWGYNTSGQLGNNTTVNSYVPVLVNTSALKAGECILTAVGNGTWRSLAVVASAPPPLATTLAATAISDAGATLNGGVNANGGSSTVAFEYGLTEFYGTTVAATPGSVTGNSEMAVSATFGGLLPGTTYHFRVIATTAGGTVKGGDLAFTTTTLATLADLRLSTGPLDPGFDFNTTSYSGTVPTTTTSITVTPVITTPGATVEVAGSPVASGTASAPLDLTVGNNPFVIKVTSADGSITMIYTVTVTRLPEGVVFNAADDVPLTVGNLVATGNPVAFALNFAPSPGTRLMVVNNTGRNPIQGTFSNLVQGQAVDFTFEGVTYSFVANYFGGTGNDLTLEWAHTGLMGWGSNSNGQLGNSSTVNSGVAVPVDMSGVLAGKTVIALATGSYHSLALCSDGTLAAWGFNSSGELGNGSDTSSSVPVLVDQTEVLAGKTVIAVAAGGNHCLVLCADGTLATWGLNTAGQLGNGTTTKSNVPVLVDLSGVLAGKRVVTVAAGGNHCLALCADGSLAAWGDNYYGQLGDNSTTNRSRPVLVNQAGALAGKSVTTLVPGFFHNLVLCADGSVAAWGYNNYGQLGDNSTISRSAPVLVTQAGVLAGKSVTALTAGASHGLALCADGSLAAWGYNNNGQLGDNTTTNRSLPVAVTQSGVLAGKAVRSLVAGASHNLAVCTDGTLVSWGYNYYSQLGDGTTTNRSVPVVAGVVGLGADQRITAAALGTWYNLVVIGVPPPPQARTLAARDVIDTGATLNGSVNAQGSSITVAFEYGPTPAYGSTVAATPATVPGSTTTEVRATLSGLLPGRTYHFRVIATSPGGTVRGEDLSFTTTTLASLADLTTSVGTLVPAFDGTVSAYSLTVPATVASLAVTPTAAHPEATIRVNGIPVPSGTASGSFYLTEGGNRIDVEVTGAGGGNPRSYTLAVVRLPATFPFASATDVPLTVDGFVAAGTAPPFALTFAPAVGTMLTAVRNTGLAPISGTFDNLAQGQAVRLEFGGLIYPFVVNYFGGTGNDLVLQWANTRVVSWGENASGQLGTNSAQQSNAPVGVLMTGALAGKTVIAVAAGIGHSLALCADGTLATWGDNSYGQLGTGAAASSLVPVLVDRTGALAGKQVTAVAAAGYRCMVLCADGTVAGWGQNTSGQLGNGSKVDSRVPVLVDRSGVLAGKTVTAISAGGAHCLVLCADGTLAAWGKNISSQLGNGIGDGNPSSVPVRVIQSGVLAGRTVTRIAAGSSHNLVLCADGKLAAWGYNGYGTLGDGSSTSSNVPVLVNQTGVLAGTTVDSIAVGGYSCLALGVDGSIAAWGYNNYGQLGDNSTSQRSSPVLVNRTGVLSGTTVVGIQGGYSHSLARCADGTMATWGYNAAGQLGSGTTTNSNVPVLVTAGELRPGELVVACAAGDHFNLALVASPQPPLATTLAASAMTDTGATLNGSVHAQGGSATVSFEYGLTPSYGSIVAASPATVSGTTATAASATISGLLSGTTYHYRVVATGPGGMAWGEDQTFTTTAVADLTNLTLSAGTLSPAFIGSNINHLATVPEAAGSVTVTPVVASATAGVKVNGVPVRTGTPSGPIALVVGDNRILIDVDAGDGVNTKTYTVKVVRLPETFTFDTSTEVPLTVSDLAAGGQTIDIALNHAPVPGTNLRLVTNTGPNPIRGFFAGLEEGQRVRLAYDGITYSFVATYRGGTGNDLVLSWSNIRLVTWGSGTNGGGSVNSNVPVPANMDGVLAGKLITDLAIGGSHGVVRCQDGLLATWGDNGNGQSGSGGPGSGSVPVAVDQTGVLAGKTVVTVATSGYRDLALCSDGMLAGWGNGSNVPVRVDQSGVLAGKTPFAIGTGGNHSVALCTDGTLAAWGAAQNLGNGGTTSSAVPVRVDQTGVLAGKTPVALAVGGQHTLVLCSDGTLAAWGLATSGQLGNGSTTGGGVPVLVNQTGVLAGKTVIAIAAGGSHNLALCADGTLAGWGENGNGQLGNFSSTDRTVPTLVNTQGPLNGRKVVAIAAGGIHSLALCADGTLLAWGDNQYLTLGTGNSLNSSVPAPVAAGTLREGERIVAIAAGYYFSAALVAALPETLVSPLAATDLSDSGATLNGSVNPQSGTASVTFEYGLTSAFGHTVTAAPAAASGNTATPVSATISGLLAGITYHYRVVATDGTTTARSEELTFTTTTNGVLADLRLSGGTLVPAFDPNVGAYLGMAPATVEAIRLTPVAAMGTPAITVNGVALAAGAASDPIPLAPGENTIRVSVMAADGIQGKTYTLTLTRLPGEFAFHVLTDIPLTVGALGVAGAAPPFSLHQAPEPGTVLTVINNTGLRPITGTFDNLAQGQLVPLTYGTTTWFFAADYGGGTGNDLVLHWAGNRGFAWGANYAGQLGNGTAVDSAVPVPVKASGVLADQTVVGLAVGAASSAANGHSLALCANGRVAAWGYNDHGQLGNGSTTASQVPVWVDPSAALAGKTVVAVSAGSGHSLALCGDGTIAAWGYNSYSGQLGNGDTTDSKVPVAVTTTGALAGKQVAAVAAGALHNLALCADGTLVAWGSGAALGNNSTASYAPAPVPVDQSGVLAGKRVVAIAAGQHFSLVLCDDGTLAAWGNNATGVLGNGSTTNAPVPVLVDCSGVLADKTVVAIACGSLHALALCADGTLAAWGANDRGQLGNNSTVASPVPVLVDQTGWLADKTVTCVAASSAGSVALASDGTMAAWGYNNYGQLGDGSTIGRLVPTAVDPSPLRSGGRFIMAVGGPSTAGHTLGVVASPLPTATPLAATGITGTAATLNGSVNAREVAANVGFEVGLNETYGTTVTASPNAVTGKTDTGVTKFISDLKPGTTYHYRVVATSQGGIVRSAERTFTTLSDNALLADLGHDGGVIAPGFEKQRFEYFSSVPFETAAVTVSAVTDHPRATFTVNGAVGNGAVPLAIGNNSIAVGVTAEDGVTTKTYAITVNRLPQEFVFNSATDIPLTSDGFAAGGNPARVVLGFAPAPGTVLTMVNNPGLGFIYGRFANLAQGQRVRLTNDGKTYDFIANYHGGSGNDLVLQWANTKLLAWGGNGFGQLGDATTEHRLVPTPVSNSGVLANKTVLSMAGGYLHSLALCADGSLAAWGYNVYGQLGNNGSATSLIPAAVDQSGALADKMVVAIAAGPFHNLALCEDGTIVAWGYNNHGQLGDGAKVTRRAPVVVPRVGALAGMQVVSVAAGAYQSFALGADGTVAAWGYNEEGELGDGSTTASLIPVAVDRSGALAGKRVAALATGQYHALALCTDGTLVSWGYNKTGQLGNYSTTAEASPVAIGGLGSLAGRTPVGISAGGYHSLAWCADGTVVAWGANNHGQLGVAGPAQSALPLLADVTGFTSGGGIAGLATGGNHNLLRLADGRLFAWGENTNGQLGDGSVLSRALPTEVTSLTGPIMAVASGVAAQHNLALQAMPMAREGAQGLTAAGLTGADLIGYAFQLDPSRPAAAQLPEGRFVDGAFVICFTHPAAVNDVVYGAEWSATMQPGSWQEVPDTGSGGEHRFAMPVTGASQGFIRLKVSEAVR